MATARDQDPPARRNPAARIHQIAAGLSATGVATGTNGDNLTGIDVTASISPPGRARTEIMLDEDGYAEIRWYTNPAAPAADVTAALTRVLAAVTAAPAVIAPAPPEHSERIPSYRCPTESGQARGVPEQDCRQGDDRGC